MGSLTCACYTSSCQKFEGSRAAQPAVMIIFDVVVLFLEQAIIVIVVIVVIVCVARSRPRRDRQ